MEIKEIYVLVKKINGLEFIIRAYNNLANASVECDRMNKLYVENKNYYCYIVAINLHRSKNN